MFLFTITLNEMLHIASLARRRNNSVDDYFEFQKYLGEILVSFLESKNFISPGFWALDLGSGFGGYSAALKSRGINPIAVDLVKRRETTNYVQVCANGVSLPFEKATFEVAICASLIEHIQEPLWLLSEIKRVLKPGGVAYISFPPFFSPVGGHQFSPFHLLGEKPSLWFYKLRQPHINNPLFKSLYPEDSASYSNAYGSWGLYPTTIRKIRNCLEYLDFQIIDQSVRWLKINLSKVPIVNEFITWHVQFLVKK